MKEIKYDLGFTISAFSKQDDNFIVDGRCIVGPIRLGDIFNSILSIEIPIRSGTVGPSMTREKKSAHFEVRGIMAYKKELKELDSAMTGRLIIMGSGGGQLEKGLLLARVR